MTVGAAFYMVSLSEMETRKMMQELIDYHRAMQQLCEIQGQAELAKWHKDRCNFLCGLRDGIRNL